MAKKLRVVLGENAERDVHRISAMIAQDRPRAALKWARELRRKILSLATLSLAFEVIPEAAQIGLPLRHLIFGNYRIFYLVTETEVSVVRVISASRDITPRLLGLQTPTS